MCALAALPAQGLSLLPRAAPPQLEAASGSPARLYDVQMVLPPGPLLFMPVASGSRASPDVPDREKASPGKAGNEVPATGQLWRGCSGAGPWRAVPGGEFCVICVQGSGLGRCCLQSQENHFWVHRQTEGPLRSELGFHSPPSVFPCRPLQPSPRGTVPTHGAWRPGQRSVPPPSG